MNTVVQSSATVFCHQEFAALRHELATRAAAGQETWLTVCLCAEWCSVCRGFVETFRAFGEDHAQQHPETLFAYLDIDEDETLTAALELDNFPAFAVFRNGSLSFFGVLKPRGEAIAERLASLKYRDKALALPATLRPLYSALYATGDGKQGTGDS